MSTKPKELGASIPKDILEGIKKEAKTKKEIPYFVMLYEILSGLAPRHRLDDSGFYFSFPVLKKAFGNNANDTFARLNEQYQLIHKRVLRGDSHTEVVYYATDKGRAEGGTALRVSAQAHKSSKLVNMSGKPASLRGGVLLSKTKSGNSANKPAVVKPLPKYAEISRPALLVGEGLIQRVGLGVEWRTGDWPEIEALVEKEMEARNQSVPLHVWASHILTEIWDVLARANSRPDGKIVQQYEQALSGRWYADRESVVCKRRLTKKLAYWDLCHYDLSNAGLTLAIQKIKGDWPACQDYLCNKSERRQQWADYVGVSKQVIKVCITAYLHGGSEYAKKISPLLSNYQKYKLQDVCGSLFREIRTINSLILEQHVSKQSNSGRCVVQNDMGFEKALVEGNENSCLSHIIQGMEAKVLKTVVEYYGGEGCVTILHDGWSSESPTDIVELEDYILEHTGYSVKIDKD